MTNQLGTSERAMQLAETLILVVCCAAHCIFEAKAAPIISDTGAVRYLSQFGYLPPLNPKSESIISKESLSNAISEFQTFVGANVTGIMDAETTHKMTMPRCGVKDKIIPRAGGRSRRYAFFGTKWQDKSLTYKITKYSRLLDPPTIDREIARALAVWSEYTDLTFTPKSGEVDIEIRFEIGEHGDGIPFDGPGAPGKNNVLAHAFAPESGIGGDAHFDDTEVWTVNSHYGTNLFQVAAHEFGHALGLRHSDINSALMAPIYRSYQPNFRLHDDDIKGIQALYGPKTGDGSPTINDGPGITDRPGISNHPGIFNHPRIFSLPGIFNHPSIFNRLGISKYPGISVHKGFFNRRGIFNRQRFFKSLHGKPDICEDPKIDTIFSTGDGHIYVFKGEHYWRLMNNKIVPGYPQPIITRWRGLPSNIDAAFTDKNGKTYFFKGSEYWVYNVNGQMVGQYPRSIREDFPGSPDNIDAATMWNEDGWIYFYKGSKFWRFNSPQKSSVTRSHPESTSNWPSFPKNIDAIFAYEGSTYVFTGSAYYRFNDRTLSMDPAGPYQTGPHWFGCMADINRVL